MTKHGSFEDLECWKVARKLRAFIVANVLPRLPADEKYRLADQMLRATRSVHNNIAEGHGRFHYLDKAKFLSNARGSVAETLDHLIDAADEGFIDSAALVAGRELVERCLRLINGYVAHLRRESRGTSSDDDND